jgi:hypothetical protein
VSEKEPYIISEVICVKCGERFISARPYGVLLKELKCPNCGKGYMIETGEIIRDAGDTDEYRTGVSSVLGAVCDGL